MKIILISDIHSNYYYLKEVFKFIKDIDYEQIYCLGDLVGYYDEPEKVIDFVINNNIKCIKGNFEKFFLGELEYDYKKDNIYGLSKQKEKLTYEHIEFIEKLPDYLSFKYKNKNFLLVHSLKGNFDNYIYNYNDFSKIDKSILEKYDYYFFGHTHIPLVTNYCGVFLINPGSIGQPRDYTSMPSFAIVDLKKHEILIKKIKLDFNGYIQKLEKSFFHMSLINILRRNKEWIK